MPYLNTIIKETEDKWLNKLFSYLKTIFKDHGIPSHNEEHHFRVWKFALTVLKVLHLEGISISKSDLEELIIAAFFHDTGLAITTGPEHGSSGEVFCKKWLMTNFVEKEVDINKILFAIKHHDEKTYLHHTPLIVENRLNLLAVLTISDDLDAFGFTGIYRYMEIYLQRGVDLKVLGDHVLFNIKNRYKNFVRQSSQFPDLTQSHNSRYKITEQFYNSYNKQVINDECINDYLRGPAGIVSFVYKLIQSGNNSVENLCKKGIQQFSGTGDEMFFINLWNEWDIKKIYY